MFRGLIYASDRAEHQQDCAKASSELHEAAKPLLEALEGNLSLSATRNALRTITPRLARAFNTLTSSPILYPTSRAVYQEWNKANAADDIYWSKTLEESSDTIPTGSNNVELSVTTSPRDGDTWTWSKEGDLVEATPVRHALAEVSANAPRKRPRLEHTSDSGSDMASKGILLRALTSSGRDDQRSLIHALAENATLVKGPPSPREAAEMYRKKASMRRT